MNLNELIKEHSRLVGVLKRDKPSEVKKELKIQEKELKGYTMKRQEYCPKCRRRTEQVKVMGIKLCKTCGTQEKQINYGRWI